MSSGKLNRRRVDLLSGVRIYEEVTENTLCLQGSFLVHNPRFDRKLAHVPRLHCGSEGILNKHQTNGYPAAEQCLLIVHKMQPGHVEHRGQRWNCDVRQEYDTGQRTQCAVHGVDAMDVLQH